MPGFLRTSCSIPLRGFALAVALAGALCPARAGEASVQARTAAIADGVSTAAGLAAGAVEMNPLGPVLSLGMKAVVLQYARTLPDVEQPAVHAAAASVWSGATASNLCVTASILSGGSFAPACLALGVAWGMHTWQQTAHERLFWEGCAMLRQYAGEPGLRCIYTPPGAEPAGEGPTHSATLAQPIEAP
jgi:hypothetical protein